MCVIVQTISEFHIVCIQLETPVIKQVLFVCNLKVSLNLPVFVVTDDADLDELLEDMNSGQYFLLDDQSRRSDESLDTTFTNPGFISSVSSVNLEGKANHSNCRAMFRHRASEPVFIRDTYQTSKSRKSQVVK